MDKECFFVGKDEYRERICEMVGRIDREEILRYIWIIIDDILKERERE